MVLAAGKGSRMCSNVPKVLHTLAGIPILTRVLNVVRRLYPSNLLVVYNDESLLDSIQGDDLHWVLQEERLGTGHAVLVALRRLVEIGGLSRKVLVLCADLPLISIESLLEFCGRGASCDMAVCSFWADHPRGLGRIIRDDSGHLLSIIEEVDASDIERQVHEVNSGVILACEQLLWQLLPDLKADNKQKEYYLTDVVVKALAAGARTECFMASCADDFLGINDAVQLAMAERVLQRRQVKELQTDLGIRFQDPERFDLRGQLLAGCDVVIDVDVVMEGRVVLGNNVHVGPFCYLKDVVVGDGVTVLAHSVLEGCQLGDECQIGPFARVRPGSKIGNHAKIGNFVEIKNSQIGDGSKVSHLSYVGDADLGAVVNVGAGTITCNYDGKYKHRTVVDDQVFIGSNSALVAPVRIGEGATIGAGSVIVQDVPPKQLALARARQQTVSHWHPKYQRDDSDE